MNEQIKTTTVDQLPEATSLDGLFVFGYASKNAVGKRSVKAPITLLKGNKGDTGAAGKDGKDGEVTIALLETALQNSKYLASKSANGLMSIEQYNFIEDMKNQMNELIQAVSDLKKDDNEYPARLDIYCSLGDDITLPHKLEQAVRITPKEKLFYKDDSTSYITTEAKRSTFDIVATSSKHVASFMSAAFGTISLRKNSTNIAGIKLRCVGNSHILDVSATKIEFIDLSVAYSLTILNCSTCSNLRSIDIVNNALFERVTASVCNKLEEATVNMTSMGELNFRACPNLKSLTFMETANKLKTVNISGTAINQEIVESLESIWASRIGLEAGVLIMSKGLYDTLNEDLLLRFVNKNITIQFM